MSSPNLGDNGRQRYRLLGQRADRHRASRLHCSSFRLPRPLTAPTLATTGVETQAWLLKMHVEQWQMSLGFAWSAALPERAVLSGARDAAHAQQSRGWMVTGRSLRVA